MNAKSAEVDLVDNYLRLFGERKLDEASKYLAPGALIVFPGGLTFDNLFDVVVDAAKRYQFVQKNRDEFFVGTRASDGAATCVSVGTLYGTTLWGTEFEGIRYIDVFIIRDGFIHEQHVWNDLAESGSTPTLSQRLGIQGRTGGLQSGILA